MKIKRQKQAKKTLSFYKYNFGLREPFQVLVDGTFSQAALSNKIQIKEQLPTYLMGEVQLCTSSCALTELDTLGKQLYGAKLILQRFQDHALTSKLKKIPGVPLLYIILNTMVLDKPSQASLEHVQAVQQGELVSPSQQQSLRSLKEEQGIAAAGGERRSRKRKRKQSNPNPLSCLKKKKKGVPTPPRRKTAEGEKKKKRSRHKKGRTDGGDGAAAPPITHTQ